MTRLPSLLLVCGLTLLVACSSALRPPSRPQPVGPEPAPPPAVVPVPRFEPAPWSSIAGWYEDDALQALGAFVSGCTALSRRSEWQAACEAARSRPPATAQAARAFFEAQFAAWRISYDNEKGERTGTGLITGYYEPVLRGSRTRDARNTVPLYGVPDDLLIIELGDLYPALKGERVRGRLQGRKVVPYPDRAGVESAAALRGKEIAWTDDAVDAFFMQVQGSGRLQLPGGETIRLAYADQNGHPYRAIGRYLVDRGDLTVAQATAPGIRGWLRDHPQRLAEVLDANPSYVFFREEKIADPKLGPKGALGVPLTPGRSVAIDPRNLPLGAPLFLATTQPVSGEPLRRLMMAQDTGGAIRGIVRADLFFGLGPEAGQLAGNMRSQGSLWLLWPKGLTPPPMGAVR